MRANATQCENEIERVGVRVWDSVGVVAEEGSAGKMQKRGVPGAGWRKIAERQTQQKKGMTRSTEVACSRASSGRCNQRSYLEGGGERRCEQKQGNGQGRARDSAGIKATAERDADNQTAAASGGEEHTSKAG